MQLTITFDINKLTPQEVAVQLREIANKWDREEGERAHILQSSDSDNLTDGGGTPLSDEDTWGEDDFTGEEKLSPAKAKKEKKITIDQVNDACKTRAGRSNRAEVLGILKKKFKTQSVSELKETQYADVIKAMA